MVSNQRIPFEEAIHEPLLLMKAWTALSHPIQTALRLVYGLDLDEEGLRDLSMFNEQASFDHLGYRKESPIYQGYVPMEHDEAWMIAGRKSAKSSGFLSFIVTYEALLGGHHQFAAKKQQVASFVVAQKLDIAQQLISDFIEPLISSSRLLEKEIVKHNTEGIVLKNGHRIAPAPPVIKNFRYYSIPLVVMDECAFWYKDAESANPDFEVIRAISPAQGQFPFHKLIGASTVWSKQGVIWEAKQAGSYGNKLQQDDDSRPRWRTVLVMQAPTPAMKNPLLGRSWFEKEWRKDPEAYKREILNQAAEAISGMFPEHLLQKAVETAPKQRAYCGWTDQDRLEGIKSCGIYYVAALDPAFRGDDFAFCIGHYEPTKGFVQDMLKKWTPEGKAKLNPATILDEIKLDLQEYHVEAVYSDQYQLESLQQLALDRGFSIIGMDFTANSKSKIVGSFLQLLRNNRAHLLRNKDQLLQFTFLQKTVGHGGYVRVAAPVGKHDDLVMVTVLCAAMAIRFEPAEATNYIPKELTPFERVMQQLKKDAESMKNPERAFL